MMTKDNAGLIAEARDVLADMETRQEHDDCFDRVVDTLEATEAERDAALAVIEEVRAVANKRSTDPMRGFSGPPVATDWALAGEFAVAEELREILARPPAAALEAAEPRTVTTVEELRGLPVDAVVWSDSEEIAYQKTSDWGVWAGVGDEFLDEGVAMPVKVLHMPKAAK